jgi:protein-disulfide isomerase
MNEKMLIPISLMIAGLLIGSGVYFASANKPETQALDTKSQTEQKPVIVNTETDHILGSELAKVFVIEYSDLECPFCKKYHDGALKKLIKKYADNENVAFVFRHMPLASKHPSSFGQAIATECAGKIGGEKKF